jgi:gluconokinase
MVIILMGVAGVGKTTVGQHLAVGLGWRFLDADAFHSPESVAKMASGTPLTDEDRAPWLERLRALIQAALETGAPLVLACSALRQAYRERLVVDPARVKLVYLRGSPELIARRLAERRGHFMPPDLLASQYLTLEVPEDALAVEVEGTLEAVVQSIRGGLGV